jgi:hypothetical protein
VPSGSENKLPSALPHFFHPCSSALYLSFIDVFGAWFLKPSADFLSVERECVLSAL